MRLYCNYHQDDWAKWLPYVEFVYNNLVHSVMGETPFFVLMGYHPHWVNEIHHNCVPDQALVASQRVKVLHMMCERLMECYEKSVKHMVRYYNCKQVKRTFMPGDKVLLSTQNLRSTHPSKKLENHWYGPFKVEETVGTHVYQLNLPQGWRIHPVFHITQLEPFH